MYVAIDTFTKWIEAEPVTKITAVAAVKFMHNIICRFGVPNTIISDNGTQFKSTQFGEFCQEYGIKHFRSSVMHPQTNGQVERANGIILQGI